MIDVYCHTSPSGKRYVGYSTNGIAVRWGQHVANAALPRFTTPLHRAIRKYGQDAFMHEVLEQCVSITEAQDAEQRWIAWLGSRAPAGYNATNGGEGVHGLRFSAETIERLRQASTGKKLSAESIAKRTAKQRVLPRTPEWRASISRALKGQKQSAARKQAHKARITPEYRAARAEQMRAIHAERRASGYWTDERRTAAAEAARRQGRHLRVRLAVRRYEMLGGGP